MRLCSIACALPHERRLALEQHFLLFGVSARRGQQKVIRTATADEPSVVVQKHVVMSAEQDAIDDLGLR